MDPPQKTTKDNTFLRGTPAMECLEPSRGMCRLLTLVALLADFCSSLQRGSGGRYDQGRHYGGQLDASGLVSFTLFDDEDFRYRGKALRLRWQCLRCEMACRFSVLLLDSYLFYSVK